MVDVAKLGYSVDTSELQAGEKALNNMSAAHKRAATSATQMEKTIKQSGTAMGLARHHALNMQYQLNDMAVGFASGQSPFTILMQQGMQMQQIFAQSGQTSIRGAFKSIGQTFAQMLNPITLAIVGVSALAGGISYLFRTVEDEGGSAEEVMKRHEALIRDIKDAYGEAVKGVEAYAAKTREVVRFATRQSLTTGIDRMRDEYEKVADDIEERARAMQRAIDQVLTGSQAGTVRRRTELEEVIAAINNLRESARDGEPDVVAFQKALALVGDGGTAKIRAIIERLIALTEEAANSQRSVDALREALDKMAGAGGIAFNKAFEKLEGYSDERGMTSFDRERNRLKEFADEARKLSNSKEDAIKVFQAYQKGLDDIAKREAEAEARRSGRTRRSEYQREIEALREKTAALEAEGKTYGMAADDARRYEIVQKLLRAARESNIKITPALIDSIRQEADAYVQAKSAVDKVADAKARANDISRGLSQTFYSAITGANSFADAMKRLADSIADAALQAALMGEGPLASLFGLKTTDGSQGGLFGWAFNGASASVAGSTPSTQTPTLGFGDIGSTIAGIGSAIGGLFGFAQGGEFTVGGAGGTDSQLVAFRATPGEEVSVRTPGQQGGTTFQIVQNNDFRGVVASERAYISRQLEKTKAETIDAALQAVEQKQRLVPGYGRRN